MVVVERHGCTFGEAVLEHSAAASGNIVTGTVDRSAEPNQLGSAGEGKAEAAGLLVAVNEVHQVGSKRASALTGEAEGAVPVHSANRAAPTDCVVVASLSVHLPAIDETGSTSGEMEKSVSTCQGDRGARAEVLLNFSHGKVVNAGCVSNASETGTTEFRKPPIPPTPPPKPEPPK